MCSHLFGSSSGGVLGGIGDVVGGLAGAYFGGPVGASLGAEAGGTLGGVAGGESVGTAAGNALLPAAGAGIIDYGAEAFGGATAAGGSDLFGVSGTPAAPSAVSAAGTGGFNGAADGSTSFIGDSTTTSGDPNIDPTTGMPIPPVPPAGGAAAAIGAQVDPITGQPIQPGQTGSAAQGNLATPVTQQFPQGYVLPPDPSTGLSPGEQPVPAATAAAGAATMGAAGGGGTLANIANTLGISKSSILPAGVAGIGLAKDLLSPTQLQGQSQLNTEASQLASQSQTMQNYLNTGTLPPGVQTSINNATSGAQAAIRSKYAQMGLSGSSMEQQELSQVNLNAAGAGAQVALNLYSQGISDANISQEIYKTLLTNDANQQKQTGEAISNLAQALSGGGAGGQKTYTLQPTAP